jgi:signal transduction histidine kinase
LEDGGVARRGDGRRWSSLRLKLSLSYLVVVAVGIVTLLLATSLVAPPFFASRMHQLAGGPDGMMGPGAGPGPMHGSSTAEAALAVAFREALARALLLASAAGILAAVGASLFVSGRVLGPVRRLGVASQRLTAGHYGERVPTASDDELGDLADSFNELASTLEATERRRLELIGDVAHELRTPVATLQGYLEGLLDGVVQPAPSTWARLHDETGRLRRLVDDLQELSRAEAGQIPLRPRPIDPAEIVRVAVDRLAGQFADKGLTLKVELPPSLPRVLADPERSVQVLSNLLSNALRYTPAPGSAQVTARTVDQEVELRVADTGVGIPAEHLPHLFERFYRVDKSRSRALGGSGIGLTIARALAEAMGGRLRAESPGPDQGATFTFTLPVAR